MSLIYDALNKNTELNNNVSSKKSASQYTETNGASIVYTHKNKLFTSTNILITIVIFLSTIIIWQLLFASNSPQNSINHAELEKIVTLNKKMKAEKATLIQQNKLVQQALLDSQAQLHAEQAIMMKQKQAEEYKLQLKAKLIEKKQAQLLAEQIKKQAVLTKQQAKNKRVITPKQQPINTDKKQNNQEVSIIKTVPNTQLTTKRKKLQLIKQYLAQVKVAMHQKNKNKVTKLLTKIEHVAGKKSVVLLKLKGYWALQQGKNKQAKEYYQKLLYQQSKDIDASLNLALLDSRMGHKELAKTRLDKLLKQHPASTKIKKFRNKLLGGVN